MPTTAERIEQMRTIDDLDYQLKFGKYVGRSLTEMLTKNPEYIIWAVDNIEWFTLSERLEEMFDTEVEHQKIRGEPDEAWGMSWDDFGNN